MIFYNKGLEVFKASVFIARYLVYLFGQEVDIVVSLKDSRKDKNTWGIRLLFVPEQCLIINTATFAEHWP